VEGFSWKAVTAISVECERVNRNENEHDIACITTCSTR